MTTQEQGPTSSFYTLDFAAMDKILGCDSDKQSKKLENP